MSQVISPRPLVSAFAPWRFMLGVDEVNYDLRELAAFAGRQPGTRVVNLASGVNFTDPPQRLVSFVVTTAGDPLFWHDYDGPQGHYIGRAAVAACENARGEVLLGPDNVVVTAGASSALALAAQALRHRRTDVPRPEAVVCVPTFPLVGAALANAGFSTAEVPTGATGRWLPLVDELIAACTPNTTVVYVNTFNNPSGELYGEQELRQLLRWVKEHDIALLHDTVSSDVARTDPIPHLLSIAAQENHLDGVITVGSMSKTRAMPGFRVGWLIAAEETVAVLSRLNELGAPSSPAVATPALVLDRMATAAIDGTGTGLDVVWRQFHDLVEPMVPAMPRFGGFLDSVRAQLSEGGAAPELMRWRLALRDVLATNVELLETEFADVVTEVPPWRGDFNTFVRVPALDGRDYLATTHALFRDHGLQTLPAPVFGMDDGWWATRGYYTRLSFALPTALWQEGLRRLREAIT
jgi:aspartate/methionine/tyrosine aminotransferase